MRPDFGFNDYMAFEDQDDFVSSNGWRKFMDCVAIYPHCERVRNYIDFIHSKKMDELKKKMVKVRKIREYEDGDSPALGERANKRLQLELLRSSTAQKALQGNLPLEQKNLSKDE
jgi:hypothetical protein